MQGLGRDLLVKLLNSLKRQGCCNPRCKERGGHIASCEWVRATGKARQLLVGYDVIRCKPVRGSVIDASHKEARKLRLVKYSGTDETSEDFG